MIEVTCMFLQNQTAPHTHGGIRGSRTNQVSERSHKPQQFAHRAVAASALVVKTVLEDWSASHLIIIHPCESLHLVKTDFKHGGARMRRGSRSIQPHGARARRSSVAERRAAKIIPKLGWNCNTNPVATGPCLRSGALKCSPTVRHRRGLIHL